jgi:DNA-binding LacI/PurR family transcriptional regulator
MPRPKQADQPATAAANDSAAAAAAAPARGARPSKLQMADIARLANVSISTVSRALSNHPRLSEETRNRINELARSLNYSINAGAQILRGKPLRTVAVAFPYHPEQRQHFKDPFFMALIGSIGDALIDSGHSMLVVGVEAGRIELLTQTHETGQAIGTIMLGQDQHHAYLNELAVRGLPFVVWGARLPDQLYCTVGSDNVMGGRQATEHLLRTGARRIAFFGDRSLPEFGQRYSGHLQALQQAGITPDERLYRPVSFAADAIRADIEALLREQVGFDAVFACGDILAMTAMATLRAHAVRVPEDVQVVGFDDISLAANTYPALSTVRQSIEVAGKTLVSLLLQRLAGHGIESVVMPTELVVRGSSRAA